MSHFRHFLLLLAITSAGCVQPPNTTAAEADKFEPIDHLIVVQVERDGTRVASTPATVIRSDGEVSFLQAAGSAVDRARFRQDFPVENFSYWALFGRPGQVRRVPLEPVYSSDVGRSFSILRGPRALLPPVLPRTALPEVKAGDKFRYVGIELKNYADLNRSYDVFETTARVVGKPSIGPNGRLMFEVENAGSNGFLINEVGEIIAICHGGAGRYTQAWSMQLSQHDDRGHLQQIQFRVSRPSKDDVRVDVAVETFHPFAENRSFVPTFYVGHPPADQMNQTAHQVVINVKDKKTDHAIELKEVDTVDDDFRLVPPPNAWVRSKRWQGTYTFREPRTSGLVWYRIGPYASHLPLNATVESARLFMHRVGQYDQGIAILPRHPRGGRLLSPSAIPTGPDHDWVHEPPSKLSAFVKAHHQPATDCSLPMLKSLALEEGAAIAAWALPLNEKSAVESYSPDNHYPHTDRHHAPAAVSADGRWFYFVDASNILYKIDTETWTAVRARKLGGICRTIARSKAGLVLPVGCYVWVIDPDTLENRKIIHTSVAVLTAASPADNRAFVMLDGLQNRGGGILMVDTASGEFLHAYPGKMLRELGMAYFDDSSFVEQCFTMSADAKYLFVGAKQIWRFRVEAAGLVFEQTSRQRQQRYTYNLAMSDDDRKIALPGSAADAANDDVIEVFSPRDLTNPTLQVPTGLRPSAVGFDVNQQYLYASGATGPIAVFDAQGKRLLATSATRSLKHVVRKIVVFPEGDRAVFVGRETSVVDMRPDRLQRALQK